MSRAEPKAGRRDVPPAPREDAPGRAAADGPETVPAPAAGEGAETVPAPAAGDGHSGQPAPAAPVDVAGGPVTVPAAPRAPKPRWTLGLFRSELVTVFRRRRTLALFAVLAGVPLLVGIAVRIETRDGGSLGGRGGGGPAFIEQVSNNGLFLTFAGLAATLPFFLPMAVGVVAGDSVAGEANAGTLRYLLVAPAGRTRLLLAKYVSVLAFCLAAT